MGRCSHVGRALFAILRDLHCPRESGGSFQAGDWHDQIHFRKIILAEALNLFLKLDICDLKVEF